MSLLQMLLLMAGWWMLGYSIASPPEKRDGWIVSSAAAFLVSAALEVWE